MYDQPGPIPSLLRRATRCCCRRRFCHQRVGLLLMPLLAVASACGARAADVLHYLPEDALGFVAVRNLSETDERIQHLMQMFELPLPAPLMFARGATGLGEGLNLDGDLLIALIPGDAAPSAPQPMVLLPIANYSKFAASIHGDPSGEICRVTIAGEDVLVAQHDDYAMLMNVEHRETLEILIDLEPEPVVRLKSLDEWLQKNNLSVMIMPGGVEQLLKMGRRAIGDQREQLQEGLDEPKFGWLLELVDREISAVAVGAAIDGDGNVRFGERWLTSEDGELRKFEAATDAPASPLAGYPDQPFVVVGGGPVDDSWGTMIAKFSRALMQRMPEIYGLEELDAEQWQDLEKSYAAMMTGLRSSSMIMLPGEEGDRLFGNLFGIAEVADSKSYLATYKSAIENWNAIMATSTSDLAMQYEVTPTTVAGAEACEIVVDVAAIAQDPNVPTFNWMLEAMFGEDGKMHQMLVAADKSTLVYGMAEQQELLSVIDDVRNQEMGLSNSEELQVTDKQLPENASWKFFISPAGCVKLADRVANEFLVHLLDESIEIPKFPACPPLGIAIGLADGCLSSDLVCPAATLEALAAYIKTCQEL